MKLSEFHLYNWNIEDIQLEKTLTIQGDLIDCLEFTFINKHIKIDIIKLHLSKTELVDTILNKTKTELPANCQGYIVSFYIDNKVSVSGSVIEYVCFNAISNITEQYFKNKEWNYIIFICDQGNEYRLYNAVAQRMTYKLSYVERFSHLENKFIITRF